ncbi:MAG: hypothetical protein HC897_17070, partial [Thermoanaerobaculia bacterium]|nr:hypothetical protein [Thermoanaerobaculia bacterium]
MTAQQRWAIAVLVTLLVSPLLAAPPIADTCETALPIAFEPVAGSTMGAGADGDASCGTSKLSPDVWYRFTPTAAARLVASTAGSSFDTVVSAHRSCPPPTSGELACNDNGAGLQAAASF